MLRNPKSISMGAKNFSNLVRSKLFACQGLIVPSLNLKVLSINVNPIVNVELSSFFNMKSPLFIIDTSEDVMDVVVYSSHYVKPFFGGLRGEFIVFTAVCSARVKCIVSSLSGEFVRSCGCGLGGKFCKR